MSTATQGRSREYRIRDLMLEAGWSFIMRAAASKGPADLILAHPDHGLALVQVGTKSKSLGPADRNRLCDAADLCSALPVVVQVIEQRGHATAHHWWLATRDKPATWDRWAP